MEGRAMGQVLHGCATTTEAIRQAIQHSQASLRQFARRYGINPKTARKWRARSSVVDLRTGPKEPRFVGGQLRLVRTSSAWESTARSERRTHARACHL